MPTVSFFLVSDFVVQPKNIGKALFLQGDGVMARTPTKEEAHTGQAGQDRLTEW